MRILFDQGTPAPLRHSLGGHDVATAYELGWSTLEDRALLAAAEAAGFAVLVTTDRNLKYQQNLAQRKIAIVVLSTTSWPRMKKVVEKIRGEIDVAPTGGYTEIVIP